MRIRNVFLAAAFSALAAVFVPATAAAGGPEAVAVQYHFAGTASLAGNTNFVKAGKMFNLPPGRHFVDLVLDRLAGVYWNALQFDPGGNPSQVLRPLLDGLLQTESMGSFGGSDKERMDFVLAARLDDQRVQAWRGGLEHALGGKGQPLTAEGFSGWTWNRPANNSFWMLRARDWVVLGRGDDLQGVRADYLQQIRQENRPHPVMKDSWLGAEIDWPLLTTWTPLSKCPFKLARTIVDVTASNERFHATAYVSYPDAAPWQSHPWRIPKDLVGGPLASFVAAQDMEAFLAPNETLARLGAAPLTNQFFCWASREMALMSYVAWPVGDGTNALRKLGAEAPAALNPKLDALDHTQLTWMTNDTQLVWTRLQLTAPTLKAVRGKNGDFLLAKIFPIEAQAKLVPPSDQLWSEFEGRDDVVYYGWELTALRVMQWRLLTEVLPIYPPPTRAQMDREQKAAKAAASHQTGSDALSPRIVTDAWLAELTTLAELNPQFRDSTVTEVDRTAPTELTVVRNSSFLFTGFELVLLSHWLADAPMGPIDYNLLPRAKVTGPGLPPSR